MIERMKELKPLVACFNGKGKQVTTSAGTCLEWKWGYIDDDWTLFSPVYRNIWDFQWSKVYCRNPRASPARHWHCRSSNIVCVGIIPRFYFLHLSFSPSSFFLYILSPSIFTSLPQSPLQFSLFSLPSLPYPLFPPSFFPPSPHFTSPSFPPRLYMWCLRPLDVRPPTLVEWTNWSSSMNWKHSETVYNRREEWNLLPRQPALRLYLGNQLPQLEKSQL